ncbi:hypothetical protein CASFOL_018739 [Castilleja foliolosa]|uniref:Chromatin-remodeling ATPase INO80 n=1 Tax=Castilleja foliolosa TaxID=1961234 RepID=A0ABD3D9A6_9LAMI
MFKGTLKEYKLKGIQWLGNSYAQCILDDEMSLGKTIQAMAFLAHLAECTLIKSVYEPVKYHASKKVMNLSDMNYKEGYTKTTWKKIIGDELNRRNDAK